MKQTFQLATFGAAMIAGACHTAPVSTAKLEAHQRWDHVRAGVKLQLAEQEYENKHFEQAIRTASAAVRLDPTRVEGYVLCARANLELGKPATAQHVLDAANRANLVSPDLIYTEAVILEQRGELEPALAAYARARQIDDTNVDYLVAQAECLVDLNRPETALELLDAHGRQFDDDGTVSVLAARIAELLGDTEAAVRHYRAAMVALGDHPMVARSLGLLLARLERCDQAVAILEPLITSATDNEIGGAVRRALAACYITQHADPAAKRILEEYAHTHPEDLRAQLLLAEAAIRTDDILTALRAVDRAHQREPHEPAVRLVRAVVQWKQGDFGQAAGSLFDLLSDYPDDLEAHCLLAEVLRDSGQIEAARAHFESALRISPNCTWADEGLEHLPHHSPPTPKPPATKLTSAAVCPP